MSAAPLRLPPEAIAARNVFCSTCLPPADVDGPLVSLELRPTQLPLALVAINLLVRPPLVAQAMATVRHTGTGQVGTFQPGGLLLGALITAIEPDRVLLDNGGVAEFIPLVPGQALAVVPPAPPATDGIQQTGPTQYAIDRAFLEQSLGNLNQLARSVRLLPELKDGRPAGFRLVDLRPESLPARLGLQRGDVLQSINGLELTSVEKAMELYLKLKSASHLSLVVQRDGNPATVQYTVR